MKIVIDTSVTFELPDDRQVKVDALELNEFRETLFDAKGVNPKDEHGNPKLDESGKQMPRMLPWDIIIADLTSWVKEKTEVVLSRSEAVAIWKLAAKAWAEKNASWDGEGAGAPGSPTSPPPSDPRFVED